jgi:hypothetical protein
LLSDAVAAIATVAGAVNDAPVEGDVSETLGEPDVDVVAALTVMVAVGDVALAPAESYATAFRAYVPAGTEPHEKLYGAVVSDVSSVVPA